MISKNHFPLFAQTFKNMDTIGFLVKMIFEIDIIPYFGPWILKSIKLIHEFIYRPSFWSFREKHSLIRTKWNP